MIGRKEALISLILSMLLFYSLLSVAFASSDSWVEWRKTYDGSDAFSVVQTSDGGLAFCGRTHIIDSNGDFLLVKTDVLGNVEWNKTYGGTEYEQAFAMIITSDGGYALTGPTSSFGNGSRDFWLVKTDALGEMEWNRFYGTSEHEIAYSLIEVSNGGYILAGNQLIWETGKENIWLVRTNIQGIPEFPSWTILFVFLVSTFVVLRIRNKSKWG